MANTVGASALLAAAAPLVRLWVDMLARAAPQRVTIVELPVDDGALADHAGQVLAAGLALVEVCPDPAAAIEVCRGLHALRPDLPLAAIICCPQALTPWQWQALRPAGVRSFLGLHTTDTQDATLFSSLIRGQAMYTVRLDPELDGLLGGVLFGSVAPGKGRSRGWFPSVRESEMLRLLLGGLTEKAIGRQLSCSRDTVKRTIAALRHKAGVETTRELVSWATTNGFGRRPAHGDAPASSAA